MSSGSGSSAIVWIKVNQWRGKKRRMVLKVTGEEIYWDSDGTEKVFAPMGYGSLVCGVSNLEFLPEVLQLKEHRFGVAGNRSSEVWNGFNDVIDGMF